jgi:hypothetical protein
VGVFLGGGGTSQQAGSRCANVLSCCVPMPAVYTPLLPTIIPDRSFCVIVTTHRPCSPQGSASTVGILLRSWNQSVSPSKATS